MREALERRRAGRTRVMAPVFAGSSEAAISPVEGNGIEEDRVAGGKGGSVSATNERYVAQKEGWLGMKCPERAKRSASSREDFQKQKF